MKVSKQSKSYFLNEGDEFETIMEEVEEWGVVVLGLLEEFRNFVIGIRDKKKKLTSKRTAAPASAPGKPPINPYGALYDAEEHYKEVIALFDKALDSMTTTNNNFPFTPSAPSFPVRKSDTVYAQVFCLEYEDEEEAEDDGQAELALGVGEDD